MEWLKNTIVIWNYTLPFTLLEFILRLVLPVIIVSIVSVVLSSLIRRIGGKLIKEDEKRQGFSRWTRRVFRLIVLISIIVSAGSILGIKALNVFGKFVQVLNTPFISSGNTSISILTLILIIPITLVASWVGRLVRRGIGNGRLVLFGLNSEQEFIVGRMVHYVMMVLVFILGLSVIGIDLSAIGILFGILGVGIGFGLQSFIADIVAGISLIGLGHIKEGDRIRLGENDGSIQHIRLMYTELTTFENETLIIPNRLLTGDIIHSYNYKDSRVVIVNRVDVSYDSDLEDVIRILQKVAAQNPWIHRASETDVRVKSFADSGIVMELRTWIHDVKDRAEALSWTNLEIWRSFKAESIEIPFPQRDVHIKNS